MSETMSEYLSGWGSLEDVFHSSSLNESRITNHIARSVGKDHVCVCVRVQYETYIFLMYICMCIYI